MERVLIGQAQEIEQGAIGVNCNIVAADQQTEAEPIENCRGIAVEVPIRWRKRIGRRSIRGRLPGGLGSMRGVALRLDPLDGSHGLLLQSIGDFLKGGPLVEGQEIFVGFRPVGRR